jgi:hypothetical protein
VNVLLICGGFCDAQGVDELVIAGGSGRELPSFVKVDIPRSTAVDFGFGQALAAWVDGYGVSRCVMLSGLHPNSVASRMTAFELCLR